MLALNGENMNAFFTTEISAPLALKILVVDDEPAMRQLLCKFLELKGYTIYEAADGVQAVEMFKTIRPNLIFLDIMLPKKAGIAVLQEIRSLDKAVGIIMMSGSSEPFRLTLAPFGADAYLQKPFRLKLLQEHIDNVMSKAYAHHDAVY